MGTDVLESLTPAQMIVKIVNEELTNLMGSENQKLTIASQPPTVVMLVGLQGAGKTTNGAKLAGLYEKAGQAARCWWPATSTARPPSSSFKWWAKSWTSPSFRWDRPDPVEIAKAAVAPRGKARQRHGVSGHRRPAAHR